MAKRVFLIVLDSYGIGNAKDAKVFSDEGANTLQSIAASDKYDTVCIAFAVLVTELGEI